MCARNGCRCLWRNVVFYHRFLSTFLKIFFNLLYHQFAWAYDIVAATVSLGKWKKWVLATVPYLEGPRVLEIGHGPGHLMCALTGLGIQVAGLDESRQMGRQAYRRLRRVVEFPALTNGYAQSLPFASSTFHQVVATFPPEFILDPNTISEVYRVLTPGGSLVVLPMAWITGSLLLERLAAWLFNVTGQTQEWDDGLMAPYLQTGFIIKVERQSLISSAIILVHARKPTPRTYK